MVTLQSADSALKSFYLNAITDALNMKTNPLLARIQQTTANVVGKEVKKAVRLGVSGGIGAGTETGALPSASSSAYAQLTATLKNLYGTMEISDKAIRASTMKWKLLSRARRLTLAVCSSATVRARWQRLNR